jgi:hypothetical protein
MMRPGDRVMLAGGVVAAGQMVLFVLVAGAVRPGYEPDRNWVSQLSLGPGGWLGVVNLGTCGVWLLLCAAGLRRTIGAVDAVRLVRWCGVGMVLIAVLPTDPGIGYPPGVPPAHTVIGTLHQAVAVGLGAAGIGAAARLGRALRDTVRWASPVGSFVAVVMTVSFVSGSVLVVLDDAGVLPGAPSGLLERVALFGGLGWIAAVSATVIRLDSR